MGDETEHKAKRERSPSYPAIPLDAAVNRTRSLYAVARSHPIPVDGALKQWGYSPRSGAGLVVVAALLKYGLLDDEGSGPNRRVRVSDFGQRIIRDQRENSPEREELIREAALKPPIHRIVWDEFGPELPGDDAIGYQLKFTHRFTDEGAKEFLRQFRATVAYARLTDEPADEPDSVAVSDVEAPPARQQRRVTERPAADAPRPPGTSGVLVVTLPIPGSTAWPALHLPGRLSEEDWNLMLAVLTAMKPGIVEPRHPEPTPPAEVDEDVKPTSA